VRLRIRPLQPHFPARARAARHPLPTLELATTLAAVAHLRLRTSRVVASERLLPLLINRRPIPLTIREPPRTHPVAETLAVRMPLHASTTVRTNPALESIGENRLEIGGILTPAAHLP
jgi:hypothetical protein